ncbi:MAG: BON domain-containing protein [Ramlibacter sp.]
MIKHPVSFLGGCIAGAFAMYYLDQRQGARRRALVRDKLVSAGHDIADRAGAAGKHAADRVRGAMATGRLDGDTSSEPQSDQQLHDRVRARLGRLVSHPRHLHVQVEQGCVCFTGHAVRGELERLLPEVRAMAGVREVKSELQLHDRPDEFQNLPAQQGVAAQAAAEPRPAMH